MKLCSKEDLAYIAGFFDGEGTISIGKAGPPGSHRACVSVANNNKAVLEWVQKTIELGTLREQKRKYGITYSLQFNKKEGLQFIALIFPYLRIKKPNAIIIFRYWEETKKWARDPERKINLEKFRNDIQGLNRRGLYEELRLLPEGYD